MHRTRINPPVIALAVWCTVSILMLGTRKTVQADDSLQSGEIVREVSILYIEQDCSECMLLSKTNLSAADCNVPRVSTEGRSWSAERPSVELQVPETLVRALLMEETDGRRVDLQVPEALLLILHTEGCMQGL
jgi:hypothetical protein